MLRINSAHVFHSFGTPKSNELYEIDVEIETKTLCN